MVDESSPSYASMITFFLALPDPCPVQHGTTVSKLLEGFFSGPPGFTFHITEESPPVADEHVNQKFVSLKFWQVPEQVEFDTRPLKAVARVAQEVTGHSRGNLHSGFAKEDSFRTVVEMVTYLEPEEEVDPAFDRCFEVLADVDRMCRLALPNSSRVVAKERLTVALYFHRPWGGKYSEDPSLLLLNAPEEAARRTLTGKEFEKLEAHLVRLWEKSPLELAMEHSLEASACFHKHGDYSNALIHAALSTEIFLDAVLGLMLWEDQLTDPTIDRAVRAFSESNGGLASRLRREYGPRLGGSWDPSIRGPIQNWTKNLAALRGRLVHRGRRPSKSETLEALTAADEIFEFVKTRLSEKVRIYPRTALLIIGLPSLTQRGRARRAHDYLKSENGQSPDTWLMEYDSWRRNVDAAV
ncbi:hypothetical protein [Embleya sp. NPDC059259]|uniref:hypothetical protein n=1 Tax=unclassified Embleya TaxID=2699296 RepID=UPI0036BB25E7